jgi:hypothetical protein
VASLKRTSSEKSILSITTWDRFLSGLQCIGS